MFAHVDLAVTGIESHATGGSSILIGQEGGCPVPFIVEIVYANGEVGLIEKNASVWQNGISEILVEVPGIKQIRSVKLKLDPIVDANPGNNMYQVKED